jgi:uncharacterized membrane protein
MLLFIHAGMMFGQDAPFSFTAWGVAAFFIVVGNVFGKTERNFYIGYRIPWTLASNANWKATHRMAGRIMVISGVLLAVISLFFTLGPLVILFIVVPALLPIFYSVYYYFRYERDEETAE